MSECKTVTLRTRPLKKGMLSFYLDYYPGYQDQETMKTIRHEGLNIYIYANPKNQRERDFQRCHVGKGWSNPVPTVRSHRKWTVRFLRQTQVQSGLSGVLPEAAPQAWPEMGICLSALLQLRSRQMHFRRNRCGPCNKFREYLLNAKQLRRDGQISKNSASGYWSTFRGFLKILYRNRMIKTNVNDFLEKNRTGRCCQGIPECGRAVLPGWNSVQDNCSKDCFPLSCLTSLRLSDILSLFGRKSLTLQPGGKCVHTITQKTKTEDIIPISDEALGTDRFGPKKEV